MPEKISLDQRSDFFLFPPNKSFVEFWMRGALFKYCARKNVFWGLIKKFCADHILKQTSFKKGIGPEGPSNRPEDPRGSFQPVFFTGPVI